MISFAVPKKPKRRNCKKGYPCGRSCISKTYGCQKVLRGQAKTYGEWLKSKAVGRDEQRRDVKKKVATGGGGAKPTSKAESLSPDMSGETALRKDPAKVKPASSQNPFYQVDVETISSRASRSDFDEAEIDNLAASILESGGLMRPLPLKKTGFEQYEVLEGSELEFFAAQRAQEANPRRGEMVNSFVVDDDNLNAVEKQMQIRKRNTPVRISKPTSKAESLSPDMSGETALRKDPAKVKPASSQNPFYQVDVETISSRASRSDFDEAEIDNLAASILESGGLMRPLPLKKTGFEQYEVLEGSELEFFAAQRAQEANPRRGEMVNSFVVDDDNLNAVEKQMQILQKELKVGIGIYKKMGNR